MRIFFFGNNSVAVETLQYLLGTDHELVGLALHPPGRQKRAEELIMLSGLSKDRIFCGGELRTKETKERIEALKPDMGLSVFFGYILKKEILDLFRLGCVNVHPALLPYNRGAYPNVWSIVEGTPAGVTLHIMTEGVDTGDIIDQREVPIYPWDTGADLYERLEGTCVDLFREAWPRFVSGELRPQAQKGKGTEHRIKDITEIDEIDLNRKYRAGDLINLLRARTFPPYRGAYFVADGRKVFVNVELEPEKKEEG